MFGTDYISCTPKTGYACRLSAPAFILPETKEELLSFTSADYCLMLPFTEALSQLTAYEFMRLLHEEYHVQTLIIGYDHRFGHNRSEGFENYCKYGKELGMKVVQAKALTEDGQSISSTLIRELLKKGMLKRLTNI